MRGIARALRGHIKHGMIAVEDHKTSSSDREGLQ